MIKVIVLILIVLVLTSACAGPMVESEGVTMPVPAPPPVPVDLFSNLVYLGEVNERVLVYRFTDGNTSCWVSVGKWKANTAIYCK